MEFIMALDVSIGKSYAVIYQDQTCIYEGEIAHNQYGFQQLLDKIQRLTGKMMVVFESTGIYSKPIESFCQKNKLPYCLLNPLAAKKQLEQGTLRSWKTDKHDARVLAQSHHLHKREEKVHQSDVYQNLRDLSRFYQEIEGERRSSVCACTYTTPSS
ncbi:transposase [Halalkalibacter sp. AB-rgal2]|uniref:IS110 family transposase n=1 Tax=Halalkalibacter sp. AB-rgal2 TaxID=3242695 RepID=UPI00359E7FE9